MRATVLTGEFTADEWTDLRHQYLCVRNAARTRPWEWVGQRIPQPLDDLARVVREAIATVPVDDFPSLDSLSLDTVRGLTLSETCGALRQIAANSDRLVAEWDSDLLPLLILHALEIDLAGYFGGHCLPLAEHEDGRAAYGYDLWKPVADETAEMEGHLEDMAYRFIARDDTLAVTIESTDGKVTYYAAEASRVIGENVLDTPPQGQLVRLRTWRHAKRRSIDQNRADVNLVEERIMIAILDEDRESDALVRIIPLDTGGEGATVSWAVWPIAHLYGEVGWSIEDDPFDDGPDDDSAEADYRAQIHDPEPPILVKPVRVDPPLRPTDASRAVSVEHAMLGEQWEWCYALPWMYQCLASDHVGSRMLRCPAPSDDFRVHHTAYWMPLLHLLRYGLGWRKPETGLGWWLSNGRPVHDRNLLLLRDIWWEDGQLEWFHAWCAGLSPDRGSWRDRDSPGVSAAGAWARRLDAEIRGAQITAPYGGGTDPFHLSDHSHGPIKDGSIESVLVAQHPTEPTTIVMRGLRGWYAALNTQRADRPVQVVVPWIGRLGIFNRSPRTGIWHTTDEETHAQGCPDDRHRWDCPEFG